MVAQLITQDSGPIKTSRLTRWTEWFILGLLVLFAFAIRVYKLGSFPDTVLGDEADNAQAAVQILFGHPPVNGFFGVDWTSQPAFSVYKEAAFIAILGFNILAMRLSSAIISSLALIPFYMLLRRQFSPIASFLASLLLATNVWYLNFSRSGWNCIDASFYMLMAMLFLMLALDAVVEQPAKRWRKWIFFAITGFFCAMGLYGYPAGRAITLAMVAFLPVALIFYEHHRRELALGYLVLFAAEVLTFAPQGIYAIQHWDYFNGRTNTVFIMNKPEFKADPLGTMLDQFSNNIRGPWDGSVNNTAQYTPVHEPQLDRPTGILVLLGMALTLVLASLRRRAETWLWWLMLLAGWGLTQLLTTNTPNGARGIGYMPTLIFFAAVSLDQIWQELSRLISKVSAQSQGGQRAAICILGFIVAVLVFSAGIANVKHYVDWQNTPQTRRDRYYYITAREFPDWAGVIAFRAKNNMGIMNVGQWREAYPIEDRAYPYGTNP